MSSDKEKTQVDAWLKKEGIKEGIARLSRNQYTLPKCGPKLLELLALPWSPQMKATIAKAIFDRGPAGAQKHKAMDLVLAALEECPTKDAKGMAALAYVVYGSALLNGYLVDNIDASYVHQVGKMLLDARYGNTREAFTHALRKISNTEAISYLEKAAGDPQVAAYALTALRKLRDDVRTLELCEKALKLKGLVNKRDVEKNREWIKSRIGFDSGKAEVDEWLSEHGIKHTLAQLYDKPSLRPDCAPQLLELVRKPYGDDVHIVIAEAFFRRKPDAALKRKATDIIMARIEKVAAAGNTESSQLSLLIPNELANNIGKEKVHDIGRMMLDKRYGDFRGDMTMVLCKIGGKDAISYLHKGAKDSEIASLSLYVLARMKDPMAMELCEKALADTRIKYKDAIKETLTKLKKRAAKKPAGPSHSTDKPLPKGLAEWSANLDMPQVAKVLRCVAKCVDEGFGKAEIAEVQAATYELEVDQDARFVFDVKAGGKGSQFWIEVFMDDENAPDLAIFGTKELVSGFEEAADKLVE
jgi:hypothetical protein